MDNRVTAVLNDPVEKWVLRMAVPTIVSMLVTTFYNMADTFFVGQLHNTSATGAVGVIYAFMMLLQAFGFFFGHGSGTFISRQLGAGKRGEAEIMASVGFFSALAAGLFVSVLSFVFLDPLIRLLGATDTIFPYAKDYLSVLLFGVPFVCASYVLNPQLRFQGSAAYSMVGISAGAVINCALDPILIFTFGFGIRGAAIATAVSQFTSFLILLAGTRRADNIRLSIRRFRPSAYYFRHMAAGGLPSLCRQGISSLAGVALNLAAGGYGDYVITALSVCSKVLMFFNSVMMGYGQGYQTVCGMNYGARQFQRVRRAFWFCVRTSFCFLLCVSVSGFVFAPHIISLFSSDPQVIAFGASTLRFMCLSLPLNSWTVLCNQTLQTIGESGRATLLAASRHGYSYIPLIFLLPRLLGHPLGLQLVQMGADILTLLVSLPLFVPVLRRMKQADAPPDGIPSGQAAAPSGPAPASKR